MPHDHIVSSRVSARKSLKLALLVCVLTSSLGAADILAGPGSAIRNDGSSYAIPFIAAENLDGLIYYLGDPSNPNFGVQQFSRDKYIRVEWPEPENPSFLKGRFRYAEGNFTEAAAAYQDARTSSKWYWEVEESYLLGAECQIQLANYDAALAVLKEFIKNYPKSLHIIDAIAKCGKCDIAKGDLPGASANFNLLMSKAGDWGDDAKREGLIGLSHVLYQQKDYAGANKLLAPYFASLRDAVLSSTAIPSAVQELAENAANVGFSLADAKRELKQDSEAIDVYKKFYLLPISPDAQARAHLYCGQLMIKANTSEGYLQGFDQAVFAAVIGNDASIQEQAKKLAREIDSHIENDKNISDVDRKEYRIYLGNL